MGEEPRHDPDHDALRLGPGNRGRDHAPQVLAQLPQLPRRSRLGGEIVGRGQLSQGGAAGARVGQGAGDYGVWGGGGHW